MLSPLLGGSSFAFGLILAIALLGIGLGGLAYALWGEHRPATWAGFALTCIFEAVGIALPYALGDQVALLAVALQSLDVFGFAGQVLGWSGVTALVVLPAAVASGVQFPLLIALLGRGRQQVARQVGLAYAWNTAGAIIGSLLGGFGLLPLLSAPGTWRLVGYLLAALAVAAALWSARHAGRRRWALTLLTTVGASGVVLLFSGSGPMTGKLPALAPVLLSQPRTVPARCGGCARPGEVPCAPAAVDCARPLAATRSILQSVYNRTGAPELSWGHELPSFSVPGSLGISLHGDRSVCRVPVRVYWRRYPQDYLLVRSGRSRLSFGGGCPARARRRT